jgi:hypothetical protein
VGRYNRTGQLLYGVVITAIWAVLVNSCNLESYHFKTFISDDESEGDWQLNYVLNVRSFVCNKPCEDGTLVLKYIVVGM